MLLKIGAFLLFAVPVVCSADMFKCKSLDGSTKFQDRPCLAEDKLIERKKDRGDEELPTDAYEKYLIISNTISDSKKNIFEVVDENVVDNRARFEIAKSLRVADNMYAPKIDIAESVKNDIKHDFDKGGYFYIKILELYRSQFSEEEISNLNRIYEDEKFSALYKKLRDYQDNASEYILQGKKAPINSDEMAYIKKKMSDPLILERNKVIKGSNKYSNLVSDYFNERVIPKIKEKVKSISNDGQK